MIWFLSLALLLAGTEAWWCTGHMLVANVALRSMCQKTKDATADLIDMQTKYNPKSPDFMQTACWADDIKGTSNLYDTWHYINYPFIPRDPPVGSVTGINDEHNVVWALTSLNKTLHNTHGNIMEQSRALYFNIHFVGDIHQPLHAITMYSHKFEPPDGDMGGNLYHIQGANVSTLHKFWDSGAGLWEADFTRPLNSSAYAIVESLTDGLIAKYPIKTFGGLLDMAFDDYAREAVDFAVNVTYTTPEGGVISDNYLAASRTVVERQATLGGYRLAYLLEQVFGC